MKIGSIWLSMLSRVLAAAAICCSLSSGQQITGSLEGNVADPAGAAIPGAQLELQNTATGVIYRQSSASDGQFIFNLVPAGAYRLTASKQGFQSQSITNVDIGVNRATRLTVALQIGALVQSVEIQASSALIDVTTARVSTNVESKYLSELPTLTRNTLSYAELAPGVQITRPDSQVMNIEGSYARVNGLRQGANVFYLDGSDNTGSFRNGALQFPNPDAVQEVQVSTANTSAEFGKQPGGVFNVVTKSGTNQFRGSAFYFFRNKNLDANTWARNRSGTARAENKIKQGGGTVGGPISRNRTFFFGSFMAYRDETPGFQNTRQFPTKAMLGGDFSQFSRQLYDPDSGVPLAGNRIPASLLDPVAAKLSELLPTVASLGDRFVWAYTDPLKNHELLAKIDHSFNTAHQVSISLFRTWGDQQLMATGANGNAPAFGPQINTSDQNTGSLRHSWIVNPSLVVQSRYSLAQHNADRGNAAIGRNLQDFGAIWPIHAEGARKYLPLLTVSDGFTTSQGFLSLFKQHNYRFGTTATWVKGKHNVKLGFESQRDSVLQHNDQDYSQFNFDGRSSSKPAGGTPTGIGVFGYSMADFLMGRASTFNTQGVLEYDIYNWSHFFFAQDEWRITPRLTLSPGLRYEFYSPARDKSDRISGFVLGHKSDQYPTAPVNMAFANDQGVPASLYRQDRNNFGPRLGLAYDPFGNGKTSIRAGFGVYYAYLATQMKMSTAEQTPWLARAEGGETRSLVDPWGTSRTVVYTKPPTPFSSDISTFTYPPVIALRGYDPNFATPYTLQWNLAVQREVKPGIVIQVGYIGNRGKKLFESVAVNSAPWSPTATLSNIQLRRPIQGFSNVNINTTRSLSWHDSLQVSADVRSGSAFLSRFTYVFGKSLATSDEDQGLGSNAAANPLDLNLDKAQIAAKHVLRYSYVYDLPLLRGKQSIGGRLLGGWQISGTLFVSSGTPVNVLLGQDWNYDSVSNDRPDLSAPVSYTSGPKDARANQYFDKSVFVAPAVRNTFGNSPRNPLFGPGQWNTDFAMLKSFRITERIPLQFRAEAFNLLNHNNLTNPNGTMSSADFGRILNRTGNRTMQMGLRMNF